MPKPVYPEVSSEPIPPLIPKPVKTSEEKRKANEYMGVVLQYQAVFFEPKVQFHACMHPPSHT